ncbi:MAG: hypothetical protein H6869_04515 [Rhodospirillales bacterium]|nr:hypothetical protein [Rhodospirillales bacterium]
MAGADNRDIEILIGEIRHIKTNLNDPLLGSSFWEEAMKDFLSKHGDQLISLLQELEKRREKDV